MNTIIYQSIESLERGLVAIPPARLGFKAARPTETDQPEHEYQDAKQEIEEGLHQFETLLESASDKKFDVFELYALRNILSVPSGLTNWVRLGHYEGISHSPAAHAPTPEAIDLLRRKLAASRTVTKGLSAEHNRNEAILAQLRPMVNLKAEDESLPSFSFLTGTVSEQPFSGQQPLTTNTKFALSQLPALRSTLTELKTKLTTLKEVQLGFSTAKDEMREDRRQYIEQRTRSHMNRNGQASLADSRPLAGKQVDAAEVEALEKTTSMFNPP